MKLTAVFAALNVFAVTTNAVEPEDQFLLRIESIDPTLNDQYVSPELVTDRLGEPAHWAFLSNLPPMTTFSLDHGALQYTTKEGEVLVASGDHSNEFKNKKSVIKFQDGGNEIDSGFRINEYRGDLGYGSSNLWYVCPVHNRKTGYKLALALHDTYKMTGCTRVHVVADMML